MRVADKKTLLRAQSVPRLERLAFGGKLPAHVGQRGPDQVGDVLTQGQPAVQLDVVDHRVAAVLVDQALGAPFELGRIVCSPPVDQVAVGVEVTPRVVEGVNQFVAHGLAGVAPSRGGVDAHVEQRRLQYARGKVHFVALRVVEGVHRLRRHEPLVRIGGPANHAHLARFLEGGGRDAVAKVIFPVDLDRTVVAPRLRMPDLVADAGKLGQGLVLRGPAHPVRLLDPLPHDRLDALDHRYRLLAGRGRERARNELAAERLAEILVGHRHTAAPARRLLADAMQVTRVESEGFIRDRPGQHPRVTAQIAPAEIGLQVSERRLAQEATDFRQERRLGDVHPLDRGRGAQAEIGQPVEARGRLLQQLAVHRVVELRQVLPVGRRKLCRCELRLELQDPAGRPPGAALRFANQCQHDGDVLLVPLPCLAHLRLVGQIVVSLRQAGSAGEESPDHVLGVLEIRQRRVSE